MRFHNPAEATSRVTLEDLVNSPSSIGIIILSRNVKTRAPIDHIPIATKISIKEGEYSHTSPSGAGINPGIINPIPFSIQMPVIMSMQAIFRVMKRFLVYGTRKITNAVTLKANAVQIHGTSLPFPCNPT